jgi:hypothetical protein
MRPGHYARAHRARHLALLVLALCVPLPSAAQQPEPLWAFDTKG